MAKRKRRRAKRSRRKKFKFKLKKAHLKQAFSVASMILVGYLLFVLYNYQGKPTSPQKKSTTHSASSSTSASSTRSVQSTSSKTSTSSTRSTSTTTSTTTRRITPSATLTPSAPSASFIRKRPKSNKPKIVFVIDDIGAHNRLATQLKKLSPKVTYAILPLLPYSRYFGMLGAQTGSEVILHLPLEASQDVIPGRGLIVSTMSSGDILAMLNRDLESVPNAVGANNHMGSRGTTDREMMTVILKELKRRGLFFLDSYTTKDSVVPEVARAVRIPFLKRGVFLDNVDEKSAIRSQIRELENSARENRSAIAIGHYRKNTLEVLADEIPALERKGFEIISLKELLES